MFSREFRLPSSINFTHGSSYKYPYFLLKIVSNGLSHNRYGFVVSKRVDKRATERNRLRRMYSAILESVVSKQGFDILVIVSPQSQGKERSVIESTLKEALQKSNLL